MPRGKKFTKPGRQSWAIGSQFTYLESMLEAWRATDDVSTFYSNATFLFLKKYGWELRDNDSEDPNPALVDEYVKELNGEGSPEQQKENELTAKVLRKVSRLKLAQRRDLTRQLENSSVVSPPGPENC